MAFFCKAQPCEAYKLSPLIKFAEALIWITDFPFHMTYLDQQTSYQIPVLVFSFGFPLTENSTLLVRKPLGNEFLKIKW